jgi:S-adenosylmethionine-diacylgycerolhomoserine-N-methlytransferase
MTQLEQRPPMTAIERYYRFHSKIYDATRWSFLFGRQAIIERIKAQTTPTEILEVGCGTGKNLIALRRAFPQARLTGVDLSRDMLNLAQRNLGTDAAHVHLVQRIYDHPLQPNQPFDLVLFSYALSMFNPGWERAIECAHVDLQPGGLLAVVDFHDTPLPLFRYWMQQNHVRMTSHLLPKLATSFRQCMVETHPAYGGCWTYLLFLGERKGTN